MFYTVGPKYSQDLREKMSLCFFNVTSIFSSASSTAIQELFSWDHMDSFPYLPLDPNPNLHAIPKANPKPNPNINPKRTAQLVLSWWVLSLYSVLEKHNYG